MITKETVNKINEYLKKNEFCESVYHDGFSFIKMEITWGDWKHDHLRAEYLIDQFCKENGYENFHASEVTEEDGSDCYSAIHTWAIIG